MSENTKRMLTFFLAASLIFSMLPMGVSAQAQTEEEQAVAEPLETVEPVVEHTMLVLAAGEETEKIPLSAGVPQAASTSEAYETVWFSFTPEESGVYTFTALSDGDTYGVVYYSSMSWMTDNYDSGIGNNFQIFCDLTGGETYYLEVSFEYGEVGSFQALVDYTPLESITFSPVTVIAGTDGYTTQDWNPETGEYDLEYYYFSEWSTTRRSTYTATFRDGTVITGSGSLSYGGNDYSFSYSGEQSYANQWTPGNTYTQHIYCMGRSAEMSVTVVESPVASISFTPVSVVKNTHGYTTYDWDWETQAPGPEYYFYQPWNLLQKSTHTITFTDGTVYTGTGSSFEYNGETYSFGCDYVQNGSNIWTVGNTYTIDISVMGLSAQLDVSIVPLPLVSLVFEPVSVMEGRYGYYQTVDGVEYLHYNEWNLMLESSYTATFSDGTVQTGSGSGFTYDGEWYSFSYSSDQSVSAPWTAGNAYNLDIDVAGFEAQIPVTIERSPLQSVTFSPVTIFEGTCGYTDTDYNEETGNYDLEYWCYYGWEALYKSEYTATFTDGTVMTGFDNGFWYGDNWYSFDWEADQGYANQWTVGNTYYITVSVLGQKTEIPVTIVPSPVVSLTVEPVTIIEGKNCWENSYWPGDGTEQTYLYYSWRDKLNYTVTFTDGTVYNNTNGDSFYHNGDYYSISSFDNQGANNQWTPGNTYTATASLGGLSAEVSVTITESPVESVVFDPVTLEEYTGGYWSWSNGVQYYMYSGWTSYISFTVTFKDGTVKSGSWGNPVEYNGEVYAVNGATNWQDENPWLVGGTYEAEADFEGKSYPVYVTITRKTEDNGYTYLEQDGKAIINGCTLQTEILQIPDTIDGYPVVGITGLGDALLYATELRIPDSVTMLSSSILQPEDYYGNSLPLKKLTLGAGVSGFSADMLWYTRGLEYIGVAADNEALCSIDGVVYNKAVTTLVAYPPAKEDLHIIPDSVTDASSIFAYDWYSKANIRLGAGIEDYKMVDGVVYNADMTEVLDCTAAATGSYVMPESVTWIASNAFADSNLTSVTISPNVTYIVYNAFYNSTKLEEITIPESVQRIGHGAFVTCPNLTKVNITDIESWCQVDLWSDIWGHSYDLYLNGELVRDLVIPESVVNTVYGNGGINRYVFANSNIETVTIPAELQVIGEEAFYGCENLKRVNITDLSAWSSISFYTPCANPLYYAHDLYLNGELVRDLVIPETVSNLVYGDSRCGVGDYAFYNASIETVTVPAAVQCIGTEAFYGCENLNRVNITDLAAWCSIEFCDAGANPLACAEDLYLNGTLVKDLVLPADVVEVVYPYAFVNSSITSLTVPASVYRIDNMAFGGASVETIKIAEGLTEIGWFAFAETKLKEVDLPDSLDLIETGTFYGCTDLKTVTFGTGLTNLLYQAFAESGITSAELPDSLSYLGSEAFMDCRSLEKVTFGSNLDSIPYRCFYNTALKTVTLPKGITYVEAGAFENSALTEVNFECEAVDIYESAFANCPLGDLELGVNVTYVAAGSFAGTNATQIKLSASVTELSYRVFAFNPNLVSVSIPDTMTYISETAFENDNNLSHVLYGGTWEQWENIGGKGSELMNATIHYEAIGNEVTTEQNCTTISFYCSICDAWESVRKNNATHSFVNEVCTICGFAGYWEYEADEKGTITITEYTGPETEVIVPDKIDGLPVVAITGTTFAYNSKMTSVTLPAAITEIPMNAFRNCTALKTVTLDSGVTAIGEYAFADCSSLRGIQLPDSLTFIGEGAFFNAQLMTLTLPAKVSYIGDMAFYNCRFSSVEIPDGITEIGMSTFENCWNLSQVTIPDSVTAICYYAFLGCAIEELTIPASVKNIQPDAFADNGALETLIFQGDQPYMYYAFEGVQATAFYPGGNDTWDAVTGDNIRYYPCYVPEITKQPVNVTVEEGETAVASVEAYGQRLSYQWYCASPGSKTFKPVGGDSIELSQLITKQNSGTKAYCVITDVLGQTATTDTITLKITPKATGIRITQMPYTVEYDLRQALRTRGLEIALTYDDNSEEQVFDFTVSGYDPNVGGEQTITVAYGGYTTTFTVTVNDKKLNFTNEEEKIEISAPDNAIESDVELVVDKVVPEEALPEVPEVLQNNESVMFDISLAKNGETVQPEASVQVAIPVPEQMESKRCKVYYVDNAGKAEDMKAQYKDGHMVFETNHFSYYAVVEVTGVTISGTVSGAGDMTGVVVKLISGGEVLETVETRNGAYVFENVVDNSYIIEASKEGRPSKQVEITVEDQNLIQDILMAILGDIDDNAEVTTDDVVQLLLYIAMPDMFPISAEADFTGDGLVTTEDAIQLLLHIAMPDMFPLESKA